MICRKCLEEIMDGSAFCNFCGAKQAVTKHKRGNGTGTVFKTKFNTWTAQVVLGYKEVDGKLRKRTAQKSGFKTKKEALAYIPQLQQQTPEMIARKRAAMTFEEVYHKWRPTHQASKSTMDCYAAAFKWFAELYGYPMIEVNVDDLQECLDDCPKGRRTKENMKALAGLMLKYAIPRNMATMNLAQYLVIHADDNADREALPEAELEKVWAHVDDLPYAAYVVAQCYLGFRPSELLALTVDDYHADKHYFVGGAKTDAGKNRIVPVAPKIQPLIDDLVAKRKGHVFCDWLTGEPLTTGRYRAIFYRVLEDCGVDNPVLGDGDAARRRYTPHSCRHTFATKLKNIQAADKDKLAIIGHTSTEMLRHYQDTDIDSLIALVEKMS